MSDGKQFPHLASAKETVLRAANKNLVFPISQPEAQDLLWSLSNFYMGVKGRRDWLVDEARKVSGAISVSFDIPQEIDMDEAGAFRGVLSAIACGDTSQSRAYTPAGARAWLEYMVHLNNESNFLLGLQRVTLQNSEDNDE